MYTLQVGKMPGTLTQIEVDEGTTIGQVLQMLDLDYRGYTVRYNAETILSAEDTDDLDLEDIPVTANGIILLVKNIKGASAPNTLLEVKIGQEYSFKDGQKGTVIDTLDTEVVVSFQDYCKTYLYEEFLLALEK